MKQQQRDVVRYWHLLELFSTQKVDPADPRNRSRPVVDWRDGHPLPWDRSLTPRKPPTGRVWQHTVYLNVYAVSGIYEHLHKVFKHDQDAYEDRPGGLSACAAVVVDQHGRYVVDSAVLSSALWGIGRTIDPGVDQPDWFEGFADADRQFREAIAEYLADVQRGSEEEEPPLEPADLRKLLAIAVGAAGIDGAASVHSQDVHIASTAVWEDHAHDLPGFNFLNSFHLDDLRSVAEGEVCGGALDAYLTPDADVQVAERVDVRRSPEQVVAGTSIQDLPSGRWLANPEHPLSTSQQFAVNQALAMRGCGMSLLGVNGPPGTGKTTMLRDILAGNVTERAHRLSRLDHPDKAFAAGKLHEWKSGNYPRRVRPLLPEFTGFEMVVASSNNAAVANVSDELPLSGNIHDGWDGIDYFADLATKIGRGSERVGGENRDDHRTHWGVIAARLGNAANRNAFNSAFWFASKPTTAGRPAGESPGVPGMQKRLQAWEAAPSTRPKWSAARTAFEQASRQLDLVLADRGEAERRLARAYELHAEQHRLTEEGRAAEASLQTANQRCEDAAASLTVAEQAMAAARARHERHLLLKPGWWESVISMGRASKEWRQGLRPLTTELNAADSDHRDAMNRLADLRAEAARLLGIREEAEGALRRLAGESARLDAALTNDHRRYGVTYPGPRWLGDERRRELHGAWLDPEVNTARSNLFRAALDLHAAFLANVTGARLALQASLDVMTGQAPADLDPVARLAAWQFLFMVVPLVSTTFASVPSMFKGLESEAIGWLLIDEAGQATPQSAVGAIWRAKRVIAVGDPMQLTPVVTTPVKVQHDLARQFRLSDTWIPSFSSVQHLADRVGRYGTTLSLGEQSLWVSAPLRAHRRCDAPMFDISNQIAYEGLMVNAVPERKGPGNVPDSQWYDVPAKLPGDHLQPDEITLLRKRLDDLIEAGVKAGEIIAISPFRAVANELSRLSDDYPGITAGTVHTAQGREADAVFLVLGGDPQKPGAKRWAAATPNLVNVAVSRAKRRLYVIGDRRRWAGHPFFDTTAAHLGGVAHAGSADQRDDGEHWSDGNQRTIHVSAGVTN